MPQIAAKSDIKPKKPPQNPPPPSPKKKKTQLQSLSHKELSVI